MRNRQRTAYARAADAYATVLKETPRSDSPSIAASMHLEISVITDDYLARYGSAEEEPFWVLL